MCSCLRTSVLTVENGNYLSIREGGEEQRINLLELGGFLSHRHCAPPREFTMEQNYILSAPAILSYYLRTMVRVRGYSSLGDATYYAILSRFHCLSLKVKTGTPLFLVLYYHGLEDHFAMRTLE